jgi:hypothetical protein
MAKRLIVLALLVTALTAPAKAAAEERGRILDWWAKLLSGGEGPKPMKLEFPTRGRAPLDVRQEPGNQPWALTTLGKQREVRR